MRRIRRAFANRLLLGRVLCGVGGHLAPWLLAAVSFGPALALGVAGVVAAVAGIALLAREDRVAGGIGIIAAAAVAFFVVAMFPFGPALPLGALLVGGALWLLARLPAPRATSGLVPRLALLVGVLGAGAAILALAAYEAWFLYPEAFSRELDREETFSLLRPDELASVAAGARLWVGMVAVGAFVLCVLVVVPAAGFGVRRTLAFGLGWVAASLVALKLGSWPVGGNLTDYGYFDDSGYSGTVLVRVVESLLFAVALLVAAIRMPGEAVKRDDAGEAISI